MKIGGINETDKEEEEEEESLFFLKIMNSIIKINGLFGLIILLSLSTNWLIKLFT